jgi:hypothetical protein
MEKEKKVFKEPNKALIESLEAMNLGVDLEGEIRSYLQVVWTANPDDSGVKAPELQERMLCILQRMIAEGRKTEAEAIFNMHRTLTEYMGYGANEEASSDVDNCFGEKFEIPNDGLIVVDSFVTRNLPKIVKICEERGVDLRRIRVRCPRIVLAAQLMRMNDAKRAEMEEVLAKLDGSQFLVENVASPHNRELGNEQIGVHFTPRTLPIRPGWHEKSSVSENGATLSGEYLTTQHYVGWVRNEVARLVPGGRVFMNITVVPEFSDELTVSMEQGKRRALVKLVQQISDAVADKILLTLREAGMEVLDGDKFGPISGYDHNKIVQGLHVRKPL